MRASVIVAALTAIMLSGCASTPDQQKIAVLSAGGGAAAGALVGAAAAGPTGAVIGAGAGGVAGGMVGYLVTPKGCYFRNKRGELWRVPCKDRRVMAAACFTDNGFFAIQGFSDRHQVACPRVPLPR